MLLILSLKIVIPDHIKRTIVKYWGFSQGHNPTQCIGDVPLSSRTAYICTSINSQLLTYIYKMTSLVFAVPHMPEGENSSQHWYVSLVFSESEKW